MKKQVRVVKVLLTTLLLCLAIGLVTPVQAQCPMCRATAESNLANGGSEGRGLNNGILYMLAVPYVMVGVIGFIWWRNRRREEAAATHGEGEWS